MTLRVATWNVEWATPRSRRTPEILRRIAGCAPELLCLTESDDELLSHTGYTACSQADYGYPLRAGRRKVILWSREPWEQVDDVGIDSMPTGRFISGVTLTSLGPVTVIGVCIPWSGSRTEAGRGQARRARWEDHARYLDGLARILGRGIPERRIVMGDFNQVIGSGSRAPARLRSALSQAYPAGMAIATSSLAFGGRKNIDHIALSGDLVVDRTCVISNVDGERRLSDHFGVVADLSVGR